MAEETVEAPAAAPEAAPPAQDKKPKELLKSVPRPDEGDLKVKIEEIDGKIKTLQDRLNVIKDTLDARESGRGDSPEVARSKAHLNEAKSKSRVLQQEKRNIYDEISAADDLKKQQQDLTQRLKSQLTLFSVDEIEKRIKELEHQQQTTSLSIKDDKKIMEDIKRLAANKPMIKQYAEAMDSLKRVRDHHTTLYTQLKAKNADLTVAKEEEKKWIGELETAKAKDDAKRSDVPALHEERNKIKKEVMEHRETMRTLRDDFNEQRKEWQAYQRQVKEIRYKEMQVYKEQQKAEYEARKKAWEEEEAKRDPWEEEKMICEQLLVFCEKYMPKKEAAKAEAKSVALPEGAKAVTKKAIEDDDPYAGLVKSKKKGKGGGGGGAAAPAKPKTIKLSHSIDDLAIWNKLGFEAPPTSDDCPALYEKLIEKREWLKTAPPKKKKEEEKKEKKAAAAAAKEAAAAEEAAAGGDGIALTKEELAKKDAEELAAKKVAEAKKAKEKDELDRINQERDAALAASGKRAAGGMHKFDPDEVDVHGGAATADDFMDAFGFGDDDLGEPDEGAAADSTEAPPAHLVDIKALSDSQVAVKLTLAR